MPSLLDITEYALTNYSGFLGVAIALFLGAGGGKVLESFTFRPEIKVGQPRSFTQGRNGDLIIFRIPIENTGSKKAHLVQVDTTGLSDDGRVRENFLAVPLSWTHMSSNPRDILVKQVAHCDVLQLIRKNSGAAVTYGEEQEQSYYYQLKLASDFGGGVHDFSLLDPGVTTINLCIYEAAIGRHQLTLRCDWNGSEKVSLTIT